MNYTVGGIVSKDAENWSAENNQRFGDIIYKLHSGNVDTMARAYIGFYAMMRQFMREDWERKISALDAWRKKHNLRSIGSLLEKTKDTIAIASHPTAEREELLREVLQA
jgi:predicted membrane-bound spermidine synthase